MKTLPLIEYRVTADMVMRDSFETTEQNLRVDAIDDVTAERAVYMAAALNGHHVIQIREVHRVQ